MKVRLEEMAPRRRTALTTALGFGLLAATVAVHELGSLRVHNRGYVALASVMLVICGAASRLLWRRSRRVDVVVILAVAVAARALLAFDAPTLSDDVYRFVWDGRVQARGINPYSYAPADRPLVSLRDFPIFTHINRPFTRTVYPPADELVYAGVNAVVGDGVLEVKLTLLAARPWRSPSCSPCWRAPSARSDAPPFTPGIRWRSWRSPAAVIPTRC